MIQIKKDGLARNSDLSEQREQFRSTRTFRIRNLIEPDVLSMLQARMDVCGWVPRGHGKMGTESAPDDKVPLFSLNFLANRPEFIQTIREITGIHEMNAFQGRIYRFADSRHWDHWHTDNTESRMLAMSLNLGREPYQGGLFSLRKIGAEAPLCELENTGPGDAIFFQIAADLEHMVSPVQGEVPKTAYAGWFIGNAPWNYFDIVKMRPGE